MNQSRIQNVLFIILFSALFILTGKLFLPFYTIILWAALIYTITSPLYVKMTARFSTGSWNHQLARNFIAALFSIFAVCAIIVPLSFLAILLINQFKGIIDWITVMVNENPHLFASQAAGPLVQLVKEITGGALDISILDIKREVLDFVAKSSSMLFGFSTSILKGFGTFLISLAFMIFTLYFFFVDGEHLLKVFRSAIPINTVYMGHFIRRFKETAKNLLRGYFLVAIYQGLAAFTIFSIFKVNGAILLAVMLSFCSFIPIIGAATIWFPAGAVKLLQGDIVGGILIIALCAFFVSTMDNFLRPFLVRGAKSDIHPLLIFFSIVGGLVGFGFNGLVVGPLILMLFFTALDIFRELYNLKPPANTPDTPK